MFSTWIIEMFLEQKISMLERFLKDHVTQKTGVMMLKNENMKNAALI